MLFAGYHIEEMLDGARKGAGALEAGEVHNVLYAAGG